MIKQGPETGSIEVDPSTMSYLREAADLYITFEHDVRRPDDVRIAELEDFQYDPGPTDRNTFVLDPETITLGYKLAHYREQRTLRWFVAATVETPDLPGDEEPDFVVEDSWGEYAQQEMTKAFEVAQALRPYVVPLLDTSVIKVI